MGRVFDDDPDLCRLDGRAGPGDGRGDPVDVLEDLDDEVLEREGGIVVEDDEADEDGDDDPDEAKDEADEDDEEE